MPSYYERTVEDHSYDEGAWFRQGADDDETDSTIPLDDWNKWVLNPVAFSAPSVVWADYLESEAIAKATQHMKDNVAGLGETFATAKQTYSMLAGSTVRTLLALKALRQGNLSLVYKTLRGPAGVVRAGADYLLEYKYGWKPLLADIYGMSKLLKQQLQPPKVISSTGKSFREEISAGSDSSYERSVENSFRQARCKLYGILDDDFGHRIDQLGLSNPLSLAWELVPYSFVVDWFIPVGATLDALVPPAGVTFLGGCTTMRGELNFRARQICPPGWIEQSPRRSHMTIMSMVRHAYETWPKAGFYAVNPFGPEHTKALSGRGVASFAMLIQKLFR
jgi:hypothetical protein